MSSYDAQTDYRVLIVKTLADRDGWLCSGCGKPLGISDAQIDHIVPKSVGGKTRWGNLTLLCRSCNQLKGASHVNKAKGLRNNPYIREDEEPET